MYGWGHNEELIGKALKGRRDRVVLTTKFGQVQNPGGPNQVNGRPEYVVQACDASLKRLGVDVIDLYYQHRVDPKVPIEETVGGMKRCVEQGKVRFLGLSEAAPETVRRAHKIHPISALQSEYSILYRAEAEQTLPTLRELGISFVAYSPLGRSLLTGHIQKPADIPEGDRRLAHRHPHPDPARDHRRPARRRHPRQCLHRSGAGRGLTCPVGCFHGPRLRGPRPRLEHHEVPISEREAAHR